jgi:hypothetical protein
LTSVKKGAKNIEKDVFDYAEKFAFLSSTAATITENIDKEKISSNYTVTPAINTEI